MKSRYFCGASAVALTVCASLWSSQSLAAAAAAPAAPAAPNAAAAAPETTTIGELVVTAEKREQNLQTVPVAVSAFTAQDRDLKGIASFQDLSDYAPGLSFNTLTDRPYIRGIGRDTDNLATESGVAIYYDGVYYGANASILLQSDSLFIDRIEILRGPQSTLYGRNADGGAINYITRRPTADFEAEVRGGVDNYDKYWYEGAVSGPIANGLNFRIGGNYTDQTGGYFKNLNGEPEGGSVTQGGSGWAYHAEAQLEAKLGDHVEAWAKVGTSDFNVTFHTQSLVGPFGDTEFPAGALFPNVFYGLCALPGGSGGLGCTSPFSPDSIVPGSVVTLPNTIATNPALGNLRTFEADFKSSSKETQNVILAGSLTWHAPAFDVKYLGGYQKFSYSLNFPFGINLGPTTGVESYQLAAPTTPALGCIVVFGGNAGCTQPLTVIPKGEDLSFIENEYFFSHELDFSSTTNGPLQWLAGLYWYHEHYDQPINVLQPFQPQIAAPINGPPNPTHSAYSEDTQLSEDSFAGFAQVDWHVASTIKLTGGIRYTADHKDGFESFRAVEFGLPIPVAAGVPALGTFGASTMGANAPALDITSVLAVPIDPTTGKPFPGTGAGVLDPATGRVTRTLDAWFYGLTGTAGVEWQPDRDTLAYAKYSRGYKTGGFNSGILAAAPETLPEFVDAYEIGLKKTFAGNFQANAAAFFYNYHNDQVPLAVQGAAGPPTTFVFNVPTVHTYGFELETIWRPVEPLTLSLNYAYLNAKVASTGGICFEDVNDPFATQPGANISGCPVPPPGGTQGQNTIGANLPQAPHNKVSANVLYRIPFEPGALTLSGSLIWKDGEFSSLFNRPYNYASPYTQVNLRATWTDVKNRYSLIVFVDNVFNKIGTDGTEGQIVSSPEQNPTIVDKFISLTAPRTYGVELQYRFR
jgi:iron complex outermembrane receptor protein